MGAKLKRNITDFFEILPFHRFMRRQQAPLLPRCLSAKSCPCGAKLCVLTTDPSIATRFGHPPTSSGQLNLNVAMIAAGFSSDKAKDRRNTSVFKGLLTQADGKRCRKNCSVLGLTDH